MVDGNRVKTQVWDTAGMERFRSLSTSFYRNAHGCMLVFDITRRSSFEHLEAWRDEFLSKGNPLDAPNFPFIVLGNKSDDEGQRTVTRGEAEEWCHAQHMEYCEISARNVNGGVEAAFLKAARLCLPRLLHNSDAEVTAMEVDERKPNSSCFC